VAVGAGAEDSGIQMPAAGKKATCTWSVPDSAADVH
jgi:hypothetical protein